MSLNYDSSLPLYHGTINFHSKLIIKHGVKIFPRNKGGVDFGPGFYLTTNYEQAKEWAKRRATKPVPNKQILELSSITVRDFLDMKSDFKPVILKFEVKNVTEWEKLKHHIFEYDNDNWRHFVWIMKQATVFLPQYNYDWIYGPVADGGLLSLNYNEIKAYANKNQLAILSNKALQLLELTEVIEC